MSRHGIVIGRIQCETECEGTSSNNPYHSLYIATVNNLEILIYSKSFQKKKIPVPMQVMKFFNCCDTNCISIDCVDYPKHAIRCTVRHLWCLTNVTLNYFTISDTNRLCQSTVSIFCILLLAITADRNGSIFCPLIIYAQFQMFSHALHLQRT